MFYTLGLALFFLIWYGVSFLYPPLILPDPVMTIKTLIELFGQQTFWGQFLNTFLKILLGFFASFILGIPVGFLAGLNKKFYSFINPVMMVIQGTPIVSYITIAMLWFGIGFYTPVFTAFVVIFPIIVINTAEGVNSTDLKLIEMAKTYKINRQDLIKYIYLPSIVPFINSTLKICSGTLWRATVVGEFMAGNTGIGYSLSMAKSTLRTEEVFAYTMFMIIAGTLFERLTLKITISPKVKIKEIQKILDSEEIKKVNAGEKFMVQLKNITKSMNKKILDNITIFAESGKIIGLNGESGVGKTTLLNIISGIIKPDSGEIITGFDKISYVFQEDRLIPWLSCKDNLRIINKNLSNEKIESVLRDLKIYDAKDMFPNDLSGGMKKRLNIARALLYDPDLILMDEPFSSLDIKTKYGIMKDILEIKKKTGLTIIIVSHDPFELSNIVDETITLEGKPAKVTDTMKFKPVFERTEKENYEIMQIITDKIIK